MIGRTTGRRAVPAPVDEHSERAILRPGRDVLCAERDGAAVLLDLKHEVFIGLDEVGTAIWRGIEAGGSTESIARSLSEEYDAPCDALRGDVRVFVRELIGRGLVVAS